MKRPCEHQMAVLRWLRSNMSLFPVEYAVEVSYTIHEVVEADCYKFFEGSIEWDLVVDIGANLGVFALAAQYESNVKRHIAIEPLPSNFQHLCRATADFPVELNAIAFGTGERIVIFEADSPMMASSKGESDDGHVVYAATLPEILGDALGNYSTPFLKIDCEGGEWQMDISDEGMQLYQGFAGLAIEWHPNDPFTMDGGEVQVFRHFNAKMREFGYQVLIGTPSQTGAVTVCYRAKGFHVDLPHHRSAE